jgi:hypothetical protein
MMTEHDRKVFAILLSIEIEAAAGRLRTGEREFIISPIYGATIIQTLTNKQMTEHKCWAAKKPFDWMTDEQFLNLQVNINSEMKLKKKVKNIKYD